MTLLELLVALTIFGFVAALAFTHVGPGLQSARRMAIDADLLRASASAQVTLEEISVGALFEDRLISPHEARLNVWLPRLAAAPFAARLRIVSSPQGQRLEMEAPGLIETAILLTTPGSLRFDTEASDALVIETRISEHQPWTTIVAAPFVANTPLACDFDATARICR